MRLKYVVCRKPPNKTLFRVCPTIIPVPDLGAAQKIGEN